MTAETFIREKLIPELEKQRKQYFEAFGLWTLKNSMLEAEHCRSKCNTLLEIKKFIEQHKSEWSGE